MKKLIALIGIFGSISFLLLVLLVILNLELGVSCDENQPQSPDDPNSYSRPDLVRTTHIHLELDVDFDEKVLQGFVILSLKKIDEEADLVILDTNNLTILKIRDPIRVGGESMKAKTKLNN